MNSDIFSIKGIKIGQEQDDKALTGCTVILCENGATCSCDIRGGAPGTRETDLLNPINTVDKVHALVLSGGSAFGLECMSGVMNFLEEKNIGFDVGVTKVPIVTGAVLFDLTIGDYKIRPNMNMGYKACLNANDKILDEGNFGAGCGCSIGKIRGKKYSMASGIGSYTLKSGDLIVSAIVCVNAFGDIIEDSKIIGGALNDELSGFINTSNYLIQNDKELSFDMKNTTIGAIITNAKLDKAKCKKVSQVAHNGYARSINPVHTGFDGDSIFTLATNEIEEKDINKISIMASKAMEKAVIKAFKVSSSKDGIKSFEQLNENNNI
ncbi:MAG: P1 family peptidase [Peptostreptococcaceae bacterium]|nr:P1 family peptidase [Peptostreptococcaceae bacterium]